MSWSPDQVDAGLKRAIDAAGGRRALSRKLGIRQFQRWRSVPKTRVFAVEAITGIPAEELRPDLAAWIAQDRERRRLATAEGGLTLADVGEAIAERWDPTLTIEAGLVDLWACFASVMFVARERRQRVQVICYGQTPEAQEARAYAMALAKVVGRASPTHVANVFGCSRQNVDNAAERYLRSRDGDDPEDFIQGQFGDGRPRVLEIGSNRLRLAKGADPALWDAQQRFEAFLRGEDLAPPKPERRRA